MDGNQDLQDAPALPDYLELWQSSLNWQPTPAQQQQFQQLYAAILTGNQQFNLTRIIHPEEFWEKHLWDSLSGIQPFLAPSEVMLPPLSPDLPLRAIDIGTGAGFPGIPIAIAQPTWHVTLLDSTRKKLVFLDRVLEQLGMTNASTLVDRAEAIGQHPGHRQQYDLALVRAVAAASVCAEYTLPLLTQGGLAILYRGQWTPEETAALNPIIESLGGTVEAVIGFKTPVSCSDRHCLYLRKHTPTPDEFPRPIGVPTQSPLSL